MKKFYIGVKVKKEPNYDLVLKKIKSEINDKKIAILYSNQYEDVAKKIANLMKNQVVFYMQILGCSNPKILKEIEAILVIGQGKFHTVSIAYETNIPTYVLENNSLWKVSEKDIEKMQKKEKGMLLKYLNSEKIGILVTSKPGQKRIKKAIEFQMNLKNKKSYLFISNNINIEEFENFGIDCWVNTACPRMDLTEGQIINLDKIPKN